MIHPFLSCNCDFCRYREIAKEIVMRAVQTSRLEGFETSKKEIDKRIKKLSEQFIKERPVFEGLEDMMEPNLCDCHCHESYEFIRTWCERKQKEEDMAIIRGQSVDSCRGGLTYPAEKPDREPTISVELSNLEQTIERLINATDTLCKKVEQVLTPPPPCTPEGPMNAKPVSVNSSVAMRLQTFNSTINDVINNVVSTTERVEL